MQTSESIPEYTIQPAPINNVQYWSPRVPIETVAILSLSSLALVCATILVYPVVEDKQDGIREIFAIATSYSYLNQLSMYIINFIILFIIILIQIILNLLFDGLNEVSVIHPIILGILFVLSIMAYSFFISVFFDKGLLMNVICKKKQL